MSFLDFERFFDNKTKNELIPELIAPQGDVLLEMAEGGRSGGGRGGQVRLDESDIKYLYQFLPDDWHRALQYRYGIGLMLYSKQKNEAGKGQSEDYYLNPEEQNDKDNIRFSSDWIHKFSKQSTHFAKSNLKDKSDLFYANENREYVDVDFGFNQTYKKLSDKSKYDFDMGQTDFSEYPDQEPKNAGYKPLTKKNAHDSINTWLKGIGIEHHHPENHQELLNQYLQNHPEIEKDENGQPLHPNYQSLTPYHHIPLTKHNYHDYLYRKLGDQYKFPNRYSPYVSHYDASKMPHEQMPHPYAGRPTGQTYYNRNQYNANLESLQNKHGEQAAALKAHIDQLQDSDLHPLTQGSPVTINFNSKDYTIDPTDVSISEYNHAASIASQAFGKTINPQDIEVRPINESASKLKLRGSEVEYTIYDLYGLHRSLMRRGRELEHLFPEQIHQLAKEIFIKRSVDNKWYNSPEDAAHVFNAIYAQRFSSKPTYKKKLGTDEEESGISPVEQDKVTSAYVEAGRQTPEERLIEWDKSGILKSVLEHKKKVTNNNPNVGLKTIIASGIWQTYPLSNGPKIYERKSIGSDWTEMEPRKIFVPLLYPGQSLPSEKQRGKSINVGAIGNSAVGEQETAFFGSSLADDKHPLMNGQIINRNDEFFSSAMEDRLPNKELFHPLNRDKPDPEEIDRASDFSYAELAKWHGKEVRKFRGNESEVHDGEVKVDDEGNINSNGQHRTLRSVVYGTNVALKSIENRNPALADTMRQDILGIYDWAFMLLRANVDHPQFWYNKDYEDYLKGQEETRGSGDVRVPSEQSDTSLKDTGFMWRANKVRDFIKAYAQRKWGDFGTRRKRERGYTISGDLTVGDQEGKNLLDYIDENDRLSHVEKREEILKRGKGQRKAQEILDSKNAPANAQNSLFKAIEYSRKLKEEAKKGNFQDVQVTQIDKKITSSIGKALIMKAISSINEDNPVVPSVREILQKPSEEWGGKQMSEEEAMKLPETDPNYELALRKQEEMASTWAFNHLHEEVQKRKQNPIADTPLLTTDFLAQYADKPIDVNEIIRINSMHERNKGKRTTPFMNQAKSESMKRGDLSEEDEESYKLARDYLTGESISITDTNLIDDILERFVEAENLTALTALRDYLLDDVAKNYYIKNHLDDETINQIMKTADVMEKEEPGFTEQLEKRLEYAKKNSPIITMHNTDANSHIGKHKKELIRMFNNPNDREQALNKYNEIQKLDNIFDANTVKSLIKESIDLYKAGEKAKSKSIPYAIIDKVIKQISENPTLYQNIQHGKNEQLILNAILNIIEERYVKKSPDIFKSLDLNVDDVLQEARKYHKYSLYKQAE